MSEDLESALQQIGRECFCLHSRMAARAVTRRYNAALAPLELEITEFSLLGALAAGKVSSITQLADMLAFERTTLVRNLKRLAERGLIEAPDGPGRAVQYLLTKQGSRVLKKALPLWAKVQADVTSRLATGNDRSVLGSLESLRKATKKRD